MTTCSRCHGSGSVPTTEMVKMPGGGYKQIHGTTSCAACGGSGKHK